MPARKPPLGPRFGYHVMKSYRDPKSTFLGKGGKFVLRRHALIFMSYTDAHGYMMAHGIEPGDARNVVTICQCSDPEWEDHFFG